MRLQLGTFHVQDVAFSDETRLQDGVLYVNGEELQTYLSQDSLFDAIEVDIARPGEETRIVHALDIVEPRVKVSGPGCVFPGVLGPPVTVGEGRTDRLAGLVVIGVAEPFVGETYWYGREAIIDMSGPGAEYSPFSRTVNLVLSFISNSQDRIEDGVSERTNYMVGSQTDESAAKTNMTRLLCLKAAAYLASVVKDKQPDSVETYELSKVQPELPKIVYIHSNIAAGLYGSHDFSNSSAVLLHPNELMDGALVNSFRWVDGALRDATYFYQSNSIVQELYARHGKDINFLGVIMCNGYGESLDDKERESNSVAKIARMLGAQGAVLTPLRPGHSSVTHMMVCQKCEQAGIRTVIGEAQLNTSKGDPGFTYWVPEADAMVFPGDDETTVSLSPMKRVIGGSRILNTDQDAMGAIEVDLRKLYGATNPLGPSKLSGRLY
ncbi:MAG: glycine/sarcosine/betaine reductase component B subunit [Dehalococcoidia bacterium]